MISIIGLGNPGKKYENTRHNAGFIALDFLAQKTVAQFEKQDKFFSEIAEISSSDGKKILLIKPQTFMNDSGKAVRAIKDFYKIENSDIFVVQDEIDLKLGLVKQSRASGSAGHNGIESLFREIGQDFQRYRIGIDNRTNRQNPSTDQYVLQPFAPDEKTLLDEVLLQPDGLIDQLINRFSLKK